MAEEQDSGGERVEIGAGVRTLLPSENNVSIMGVVDAITNAAVEVILTIVGFALFIAGGTTAATSWFGVVIALVGVILMAAAVKL